MSGIPYIGAWNMSVNRLIRGIGPNEQIFFTWDSDVNPNQYKVVHENLDCGWKNLGNVRKCITLPSIYFPAYGKLAVIGTNSQGQQVRFVGELKRGFSYHISNNAQGDYNMETSMPMNCNYSIKA